MKLELAVILFVALAAPGAFCQSASTAAPASAASHKSIPVYMFDPNRDAAADIQAAVLEAHRTGKRIILEVGGDWCQYCHEMYQLFQEHPDLLQLRDSRFITVAIAYDSSHRNDKLLSGYGKVLGIPHFFVLEKDGTLLYSQHVLDLRADGAYSSEKMREFLTRWTPPGAAVASGQHPTSPQTQ